MNRKDHKCGWVAVCGVPLRKAAKVKDRAHASGILSGDIEDVFDDIRMLQMLLRRRGPDEVKGLVNALSS